jgi:hypothetical protein
MARRKILDKICSVEGCGRNVEIIKHMLCKTHSIRYYRLGDAFAHVPIEKRTKRRAYKKRETHGRCLKVQAEK